MARENIYYAVPEEGHEKRVKKYRACNCDYGGVDSILCATKYEDNKIVQRQTDRNETRRRESRATQ